MRRVDGFEYTEYKSGCYRFVFNKKMYMYMVVHICTWRPNNSI